MKQCLSSCALILSIGMLLGLFATGCGRVELLEYGDEDTYAKMDSGIMAPPDPSDIDLALKTIYVPGHITPFRSDQGSLDNYFWAISTIIKTLDLIAINITDLNGVFSINNLVDSLYYTLSLNDITISKDTLREIIIITLNEAINEVKKEEKEHKGYRFDPDKAAYFALGERLYYNNYNGGNEITEANADDMILDTGSFVILSAMIQQAISEAINESISQAILDYVPKDLQDALLPRGIPIRERTLPYFIKQTLLKMNDELNREKHEKYIDTFNVVNPHINTDDPANSIRNPDIFKHVRQEIWDLSVSVIITVGDGAEYFDFEAILRLPEGHQGLIRFGWSG